MNSKSLCILVLSSFASTAFGQWGNYIVKISPQVQAQAGGDYKYLTVRQTCDRTWDSTHNNPVSNLLVANGRDTYNFQVTRCKKDPWTGAPGDLVGAEVFMCKDLKCSQSKSCRKVSLCSGLKSCLYFAFNIQIDVNSCWLEPGFIRDGFSFEFCSGRCCLRMTLSHKINPTTFQKESTREALRKSKAKKVKFSFVNADVVKRVQSWPNEQN